MKKTFVFVLLLAVLALVVCGRYIWPQPEPLPVIVETPTPEPTPTPTPEPTPDPAEVARRLRQERLERSTGVISRLLPGYDSIGDFLLWLEKDIYPQALEEISSTPEDDIPVLLYRKTGESAYVLYDRFLGLLDSEETARAASIYFAPPQEPRAETVLTFGGDINIYYTLPVYRANNDNIESIFKDGLFEEMQESDVFFANNEFVFTNSKKGLPGKEYLFRTDTENVHILADMGVNLACLANNHVYDYGLTGFEEMLDALDEAGIPRIGAGRDIDEASKPVYFIANGKKIAYVAASCIERIHTKLTPGATEDSPGIFRADEEDSELIIAMIGEAAACSDYVIASLHWGVEATSKVEDYQKELGRICIDAGADAVVGHHAHVLQGAEFYNGKPIIYNLGNFWFSTVNVDNGMLKLILREDGGVTVKFLPLRAGIGYTSLKSGSEAERILAYYEKISFGVKIDSDGTMTNVG